MAPPCTRAVVYEDPTVQQFWAPRGLNAWYCGLAVDHYRNIKFLSPKRAATGRCGLFNLFPQHWFLPTLNPTQYVDAVYGELREYILALLIKRIQRLQKAIIKSLATIAMDLQPSQRVATEGDKPSK